MIGPASRRVGAGVVGRPLRVLHVSEVHWGGVVSLLDHFVREQVDAGHEVHVLAHRGMPRLPEGATMHPWSLDRSTPRSSWAGWRELRSCLRLVEPDVVHLHSFVAGAFGRLPLGLSGMNGSAVVYQPHAWSDQLSARRWFAPAVRSAERSAARRTDLIVTNGPDELTRAVALGVRAPGTDVGVAVDLARFRPPTPAERESARARLGLGNERVALVLARLSRQKGQDQLIPVWRNRPLPGTVLALVGPGEPAELEALAGEEWDRSVVWFGEHADVLPWLWAADVMLLCSRYEGLPIVVAEAMATGLPVVSTAVDGVTGILTSPGLPRAGSVVPLGAMQELIAELGLRLQDETLRQREAAAGVDRAHRLFSPAVISGRVIDAYQDAMRRRSARP